MQHVLSDFQVPNRQKKYILSTTYDYVYPRLLRHISERLFLLSIRYNLRNLRETLPKYNECTFAHAHIFICTLYDMVFTTINVLTIFHTVLLSKMEHDSNKYS